jgi:hypothetical protein
VKLFSFFLRSIGDQAAIKRRSSGAIYFSQSTAISTRSSRLPLRLASTELITEHRFSLARVSILSCANPRILAFLSLSVDRALVLYRTLSLVSLLSFTCGLSSRWILVIDAFSHSAREDRQENEERRASRTNDIARSITHTRKTEREREREMLFYTCLRIKIERERKKLLHTARMGERRKGKDSESGSKKSSTPGSKEQTIQFSMIQ